MWHSWWRSIFKKKVTKNELFPDEVFLDSTNLPEFNQNQLEGKISEPISKATYALFAIFVFVIFCVYGGKVFALQIINGNYLSERAERNRLQGSVIFAERGAIYDRNGVPLAYNAPSVGIDDFSNRMYKESSGLSHILGYVTLPQKDKNGNYFQTELKGVSGVEAQFDSLLSGMNGKKIIETDASGKRTWESTIEPPVQGENIYLSIDSRLNEALHRYITDVASARGFKGGAGAIMDITNGEMLALTSYPEFDSNVMTKLDEKSKVNNFINDKRNPFLNRIVSGLYAPGSIVKPFMALSALAEKIISPEKEIVSTGSISIQNPYDPNKKTLFTDWKAHGPVDMRRALSVSSNVYFYVVGGGYEGRTGLGIDRIYKYMSMFGFGKKTGINLSGEAVGTVPNPSWKKETFEDGTWRIGDTYLTSIGQYGFQVTPLQALRATSFIANNGVLLSPSIIKGKMEGVPEYLPISDEHFQIVREGMRQGALEGTAKGLADLSVKVAAKTGTAELGVSKEDVNSWIIGFYPYEKPKYAFVVTMEKGSRTNTVGAVYVMRSMFEWMSIYTPEYLK